MRVLGLCEDQSLDRFIVQPLLEQMMKDLGRAAKVEVPLEPRIRGIDDLFKKLPAILAVNRYCTDLFVLIVDKDCDRARNSDRLQRELAAR